VATKDFRFEIEEAFTITGGSGCAVVGRLASGPCNYGDTVFLHAPDAVLRVDGVQLVIASELRSLHLPSITKEQVPSGSVLLAN
jgi:hypothetical protein